MKVTRPAIYASLVLGVSLVILVVYSVGLFWKMPKSGIDDIALDGTIATLHAAAARTANDWSRRMFNLVVTNVPGPQFPLYAGGARMLAAYPVVPLPKGQAVSIGATSYDGGVYIGLNGDRDAMADLDVLVDCLEHALSDLLDTLPKGRRRRRGTVAASTPQG